MKHLSYRDAIGSQNGFTLIELMVSLALGLLVSAAVMQIYILNTKTAGIQNSASELVENATFNIPVIDKKIRLAGLGLANTVKDSEIGAGVILTSANNAPKDKEDNKLFDNLRNGTDLDTNGVPKDIRIDNEPVVVSLLTHTGDQTNTGTKNAWTGASNFKSKSGQLTIQYRVPQNMYDCEGNLALGPRQVNVGGVTETIDGQVIVERFYLRASNPAKPEELSLYCDAGKYITEKMDNYAEQGTGDDAVAFTTNNAIKDFGDAGAEIVTNVDYFDILLATMKDKTLTGTAADDNTLQYYTVKDYLAVEAESKPIVVGIKYALILRSDNAVLTEDSSSTFDIFGNTVKLKEGLSKAYVRTVVESNITLRNANKQNQ